MGIEKIFLHTGITICNIKGKVKVKVALYQATKAQRGTVEV
jgi:hypothetical protein